MGATNSCQVPDPERACALIQLHGRAYGAKEEILVAVPVHESVFEGSSSHPLFKLLHAARTEPAVRHWYAGATSAEVKGEEPIDRSVTLEPELSPEELYQEIFSSDAETAQATSRWMFLTIGNSAAKAFQTSFITVEQTTALVVAADTDAGSRGNELSTEGGAFTSDATVNNSVLVAGYVESSHGSSSTMLRYWMVKTFSTEGRSLVLFQAAAFMEARKMRYHKTPRTPMTVVDLVLRVGDISALRMLEHTFRRLVPNTCSENMMPAVLIQRRGPRRGCPFLAVRLSGEPLAAMVKQLDISIYNPETASLSSVVTLTCLATHRQNAQVATPFAPFIKEAKAIWSKENAIVTQVQPNLRQRDGVLSRHTAKQWQVPVPYYRDDAALASALSQQLPVTCNAMKVDPIHAPTTTTPQPALAAVSAMPVNAPFYKLPANTSCKYFHRETGTWFPMLYPEQTARLTLTNTPHQSGHVYLETADCLKLQDDKGNVLLIQPLPKDTVQIVVNSGTLVLQFTRDSPNGTMVQVWAP